jgi:predicted dehydrogenase
MVLIGGIALNKIETWKFVEYVSEDEFIPSQYSQEVETGYGISHGPLLQNIIDTLQSGEVNSLVPAEDAIDTARVVHALYRSDEEQCWVKLADNPVSNRLGK